MARFAHGRRGGLVAEYLAAADFLLGTVGPGVPLALVGYSFGCTLLAAAERPCVRVLVAPAVGVHGIEARSASEREDGTQSVRTCVPTQSVGTRGAGSIAPHGNFAADEGRLAAWLDRLTPPYEVLRPKLDGHFFRGHEDWLVEADEEFWIARGGKHDADLRTTRSPSCRR